MTPQQLATEFVTLAQSIAGLSQADYDLYINEVLASGHQAVQGRRPCPVLIQSTSTGAQE